ncbi:MAG: hypothetical protein ACREKQ_15810 [Candidatus Rokuibacteriota bacterium]
MIEFFVFALLALHGLACTTIMALLVWRSARQRDRGQAVSVPEKLEPPDLPYPDLEGHASAEIFAIMAECFPRRYEMYVTARLSAEAERELWLMCCAVHDARAEIEEICS